MIDFLKISTRQTKNGLTEIYPTFIIRSPSQHLMIRGGDFYAIWVEEKGLWSTSEQDAVDLIDRELDAYVKENASALDGGYRVMHMWNADSNMVDKWHKYCQKQMRDSFHMLDEKLIFSNTPTRREDYASKRLPYPLEAGDTSAWDQMMRVLYAPAERHKIEWAIGSIVSGDSRKLQKFMVLYGAAGTGKSTVIGIVEELFQGYTATFDSKALGQSSNAFALEPFKKNPLVAIEHDGDLSRIEDNTRINSLVSHERMSVNEKFSKMYENNFKCFLFMGTNRPVKITDAKSGLLRRLIDVSPTGDKLENRLYFRLREQIRFELGAIAQHCLEVYRENPGAYDEYIPTSMLSASNDFYNFVLDSWPIFRRENETTLKAAWAMYKTYCDEAKVAYPYSLRAFKEELKNYFREYVEREQTPDGTRVRSRYRGFRTEKFETEKPAETAASPVPTLGLKEQPSIFDQRFADCPAQYATDAGTPGMKWENVKTTLRSLDTARTHYVRIPENVIVIDFDIPGMDGEKDFARNLEEAAKWPPTYAEVSQSGKAIHLHYIYNGDVTQLARLYADHIEIKVFTGGSSLRRRRTLCNDLPIATLTQGLPLKEAKKTVNFDTVQSEKGLRSLIRRNLAKEIHPGTKPSIDFIDKILADAYASGLKYDVSDMKNAITYFAAGSTHHADECLRKVLGMRFKSEERSSGDATSEPPIIFFDVEVFPNLFLVNWKLAGDEKPVVRMINPKPEEIEELMRYRLVGFNCRRYDNHILYARIMGYSNPQLYDLSQRIINGSKRSDAFFGEAYNVSYTDVYDFASTANKKSLKKFEIELGIHHLELGLPFDKPVPEELWPRVAEYCDNDVLATEAVFNHLSADWTARQILADLAGMTVNDTTNSLTTRIIFGGLRKPQSEFLYRDLSQPVQTLAPEAIAFLRNACGDMMARRHGEAQSLLPYFPGYSYERRKTASAEDDSRKSFVSVYRGEEVGEGGYVYAEPGMYGNVALLDVASMHPHSVIAECLFGPRFTARFKEIVDGRVSIKHEAWDDVNRILDGKLTPYIQKVKDGEMTAKDLANALKTAINSVYGLTSAAFDNTFRDVRNRDNIVAKRGALFMVDLKHEVQMRGFTVAHIKTDSIKIPDATPEIISFVMDFGRRYGYTFEHEATYDRMCLVNDSVYIARYDTPERCMRRYGYIPDDVRKHPFGWTATGKQFAVPYVFKTLFSHESIELNDLCETFSVSGSLYLDMNESLPDVSAEEKELAKLRKKGEVPTEVERELLARIEPGHNYRFVGRVGEFAPVKPGCGGGLLLREDGGKYAAAANSSGYRWLESEMVRSLNLSNQIDRSFYQAQVDAALTAISKYGDAEWFRSDDPYDVPPEG